MKELLKKLRLREVFITELEIQKIDFVNRFRDNVDEGGIGFFSDSLLDIFSSGKNEYKGHVGFDEFKIKRRRRLFDMNLNMAVAKGTFSQKGNVLIITTEINGLSSMMIPFYIFVPAFYLLFAGVFFLGEHQEGMEVFFFLPFIVIHGFFMLGIPYFMMRRSTKRMKHELEREFYFMIKKAVTAE